MMKSYNSFEELVNSFPQISKFIQNHRDYLAHTSKLPNVEPEKLIEHIEKVNKYALKLIDKNKLDDVVDKLIRDIIVSEFVNQVEMGNFIKALFIRAIIFHDYGKVNPNFQKKKMENPLFRWDNSIKIDSQHSKLSAFIFINYHLNETIESAIFNSEEKKFLWVLIFLFANPIFRHHSSYLDHQTLPFSEEIYLNLKRFLNDFKIQTKIPLDNLFSKKGLESISFGFQKKYAEKVAFPLFALLKLNFSLLTASDYYATNAYSNGFEVNEFGLMDYDFKEKIYQNFFGREFFDEKQESRNFNFDLIQKFSHYQNYSFKDLQVKNKANLNILRQKLMAETLTNIRENSDKNIFYLEAPTGSGKTNMSLGIATELLHKNESLNKIFYVFPFNTLITQTFSSVKSTLNISEESIVQLHSKAGFHQKYEDDEDGLYGNLKMNYIDNLFINYPITLLSHIKFFDILKSNSKENNYILHRLSNSIIVIDELQSYTPKHWDKIIYILSNYAKYFNLKIILMSATLPKIGDLENSLQDEIIPLVTNKDCFFQNPNFSKRVDFDFSLIKKWQKPKKNDNDEVKLAYLEKLKTFLFEEAEIYDQTQKGGVRVIIEFIKKKTAGQFLKIIEDDNRFDSYEKYLISGEILEPRRKQIIDEIKSKKYDKVLLISTQVVEAGVDIDMDLGFKDKSLIDSDEQLAGRVNRNASKQNCKVYIFDFDDEALIYKKDLRYKITKENINQEFYEKIIRDKSFNELYDLVKDKLIEDNKNEGKAQTLIEYKTNFKNFDFNKIHFDFRLIEEDNHSVFVRIKIPKALFLEDDLKVLDQFSILPTENDEIDGKDVWNKYLELIELKKDRTKDFMLKDVDLKRINSIVSKFIFSIFSTQKIALTSFFDDEVCKKTGIIYLDSCYQNQQIYTLNGGFDNKAIKDEECFL